MADERPRKRRKRRRGRRGGTGAPPAAEGEPQGQVSAAGAPAPPAWQWATFPVFFAFVLGALLILLVAPAPNTGLYAILFFVFLGAAAFGLAHMVTRTIVARRRGR